MTVQYKNLTFYSVIAMQVVRVENEDPPLKMKIHDP